MSNRFWNNLHFYEWTGVVHYSDLLDLWWSVSLEGERERDNDRVMMICSIFWSDTSSALSCQYKCVANWLYYYEVDRFPHRFPTTGMHLHSPRDSCGHGQSFRCLDHFPTCCRQLVLSSFSLSFATHHNLDLLTGILYYGMLWRFFWCLVLTGLQDQLSAN